MHSLHVGHIVVDLSPAEVGEVVSVTDVEDTIISVFQVDLFFEFVSPLVGVSVVRPVSFECLCSVRIAHFNQFLPVGEDVSAKDRVCVARLYTHVFVELRACERET